jgi:hypothetical protein
VNRDGIHPQNQSSIGAQVVDIRQYRIDDRGFGTKNVQYVAVDKNLHLGEAVGAKAAQPIDPQLFEKLKVCKGNSREVHDNRAD